MNHAMEPTIPLLLVLDEDGRWGLFDFSAKDDEPYMLRVAGGSEQSRAAAYERGEQHARFQGRRAELVEAGFDFISRVRISTEDGWTKEVNADQEASQ